MVKEKHFFNFAPSSTLNYLTDGSNASPDNSGSNSLKMQTLKSFNHWNLKEKGNSLSPATMQAEQSELLHYCVFYFSSLENYLTNSNSSHNILTLGANQTQMFLNGSTFSASIFNQQHPSLKVFLNNARQSGKFKWIWYNLPISSFGESFYGTNPANFHLKLALPQSYKNSEGPIEIFQRKISSTFDIFSSNSNQFTFDSVQSLENPISSYLKAARLLDLYSNKNQTLETQIHLSKSGEYFPLVSTSLFEKFFSYNTLLNETGSKSWKQQRNFSSKNFLEENFKSFSSLFLKEGIFSANVLTSSSKNPENSSILYEKFSKKKLYNYLFQSLQKTMETKKTQTEISFSSKLRGTENSVNSLEKLQSNVSNGLLKFSSEISFVPSVQLLKKQYIKYEHPLLMSSDSNASFTKDIFFENLQTDQKEPNIEVFSKKNFLTQKKEFSNKSIKTNIPFYVGQESSIPLQNLNVQEKEMASNSWQKNLSFNSKESFPFVSLNASPSKFLNIYETKVKDFLIANSLLVSNPVTNKITTLLGNETNYLSKTKQLNLILENSNLKNSNQLKNLGLQMSSPEGMSLSSEGAPRGSKIEKVLRAYFSQKNSGFSNDGLILKTSTLNKKSSGSTLKSTPGKSIAYLQTHLKVLKKKMYNNLNNISKLETKSFWLKLKHLELKSVSLQEAKNVNLNKLSKASVTPNLKGLQLMKNLNANKFGKNNMSARPLAYESQNLNLTQKKKFVLYSNNTILSSFNNLKTPTSRRVSSWDRVNKSKFSPRLLVNSRLFLTKAGLASNFSEDTFTRSFTNGMGSTVLTTESLSNEKSSRLYNVLKANQKKRRRKKIKKETRRRKKRKRFYPRPSWIRFQLYKTVSQTRYDAKASSIVRNKLERIYQNERDFSSMLTKSDDKTIFYGTDKSAFTISGSVSRELKRSLWKSYWLRSNLNQYLKNVETSLTNIKESTQSWECFKNIRTFMNYLLGFNSDMFTVNFLGNTSFAVNLNKPDLLLNSGVKQKPDLNKWETALYLAEYNKISTSRIQQWISQIRENLTLNGQIKIRSSKVSPLTNNITQVTKNSLNKNSDSIQFSKLLNLLTPNSNSSLLMPSASQLRYYWAFSKTATATTKDFALDEKKWATTKNREQTKNNKTKKLSKDASNYLQTILNERSFVTNYTERTFKKFSEKISFGKENHLKEFPTTIFGQKNSQQRISSKEEILGNFSEKNFLEGEFLKFLTKKKFFNAEFLQNFKGNDLSQEANLTTKETVGENVQGDSFTPSGNNDLNFKASQNSNEALIKLLEKSLRKVRQQEEKLQILGYPKVSSNISGLRQQPFVPNNRSLFASVDDSNVRKKVVDFGSNPFSNNVLSGYLTSSGGMSLANFPGLSNQSFMMVEHSYVKLTNKSAYWWSANGAFPWESPRESSSLNTYLNNGRGHLNLYSFYQNSLLENPFNSVSSSNPAVTLWTSALLFHFCTLLSIFSISQIRGLLKFYLLILSKIYKTSVQVLGLTMDSISRLKFDQFTTLAKEKSLGNISQGKISTNHSKVSSVSNGADGFMSNEPLVTEKLLMNKIYTTNQTNLNPFKNLTGTENLKNLTKQGKYQQYDTTKRHFYTFTEGLAQYKTSETTLNQINLSQMGGQTKTLIQKGKLFETRLFLYYFVNACLKKPLYFFAGNQVASKSVQVSTPNNNLSKKELRGNKNLNLSQIQILKTSATFKTLLFMTGLLETTNTVYTKTSKLLKEAKTQVFEGSLRSIYTFLEKPGELIIDWIAYLFLVEWASDMTNTVPENIDLAIGKTSYKITRNLHFLNASTLFVSLQNNLVARSFGLKTNQNFLDFMILGSTFLQYRFYHLYEILLMQFYQPDTDLIVRQKKGVIFWDIWGDFLTQVAEDSNINISELTSLKEEQIRLFEKCESLTDVGTGLPFSFRNYISSVSKETVKENAQQVASVSATSTGKKEKTNQTLNKKVSMSLLRNFSKNNFVETVETLEMKKFGLISSIQTVLKQSNRIKGKSLSSIQTEIAVKSPLAESANRMYLDPSYFEFENNLLLNAKNNTTVTWGAQQFLSYQGKDTELFIDLHPRGSLELVSLLKSNSSIQQPIGSLVCQIFSGLLSKQISKNMLIVGSYNNRLEKTLLVQAIAGETELKIITDSAYRYAMVYRGVAVGIKLLRDVFDSLVATGPPCLFLIEDIHAIGERRPMLISDDENSSETSQAKSDEIHEKNQVLYQLSKHMITHYKKPYKGDFSLLIPTNHFCFDFFLGVLSREGSQVYPSRKHPVSSKIALNNNSTSGEGESAFEKTLKEIGSSGTESRTGNSTSSQNKLLTSRLHIKKSELLAPPATSPFSVLTLKEEKKFKPTKLVKEMPWAGLPGEQYSNLISSKASYSIRVKVALLADMAISSLSVKLDMITDLLVIIDSVKGNRGFVVFATTHVPYILDPALRRPGRFDETISLGLFPTVFSRWEVLKSAFSHLNSGFSPSQTYSLSIDFSNYLKESLTTNLQTNYNANPFSIQHIQKTLFSSISSFTSVENHAHVIKGVKSMVSLSKPLEAMSMPSESGMDERKAKSYFSEKFSKQKRKILSQTYFNASQMLISTKLSLSNKAVDATNSKQILNQQFTNGQAREEWEGLVDFTFEFAHDNSRFISLYAAPKHFKNHLVHLISGKLGEIFLFTGSELNMNKFTLNNSDKLPHFISSGVYSSTGLATWQALTALIQSFIHKRFIYHTNLIVPKLLNFTNYSSLLEPSSPPSSSILLPARRYENYRRSLAQYTQKRKTSMSIFETIQLHQQQRNVKRLYRLPVQESFRSELIENRLTGFSNASNMIGSHEALLQKPTSTNWFVRNRIFMRHQNYLTNQWWNGQLPEHNAETTYLSDIDWRYTFIESIGDLSFDFPDADQHYSPRNRRWLLTTGSYQNWFDFDKSLHSEIYSHLIFESFIKAFHIFEQNREMLDFYAFYVLKNGVNNSKVSHERVKLHQRFIH